jgi:hypothetical protein
MTTEIKCQECYGAKTFNGTNCKKCNGIGTVLFTTDKKQNMEKTAMQMLLENIDKEIEATKQIKDEISFVHNKLYWLGNFRTVLTELLPTEQQQIEAAHVEGQAHILKCFADSLPKINLTPCFLELEKARTEGDDNASDYFKTKYQ